MQRMDEWPAWQRWGALGLSWTLYLGGFAVMLKVDNIALRVVGLAILCIGLWLLAYAGRAVFNERLRAADRWNMRVMLPTMAAYLVLMLYVWPLEARIHAQWLRLVITLSPVLFLAIVILAFGRYITHCDELERRQQLEAVGIAAGVVSVASFGLALLAITHLIAIDAALMLLLVFPALCFVFGCVNTWSKWRNRAR